MKSLKSTVAMATAALVGASPTHANLIIPMGDNITIGGISSSQFGNG